jgi:catechol 2,3-dioxygenase-like lactoylglutathione lyase family enzyme
MSVDAAKWLYRIDANYTWTSPFRQDADYAFFDAKGRLRLLLERNGAITVTRGYTWNGCSPKLRVLDLLFGTPEGVVNARTGQRKTYFASLVHDALYQFLSDDLPLTRAQADRCFLLLMRESAFLLAPVYWGFVRLFGGLVHFSTARWRDWDGRAMRLGDEIPAPPPAAAGATAGMSAALPLTAARAPATGAMSIASLDHMVLYCTDVDASIAFYVRTLGMDAVTFGGGRRALAFGRQKINLHQSGREFVPHAATPARGAGDFCLITTVPLDDVIARLNALGVPIVEGPVAKTGAVAPLRSVYVRDPDGNLVEISNEVGKAAMGDGR